jgi:hypothetical protein
MGGAVMEGAPYHLEEENRVQTVGSMSLPPQAFGRPK